LTSWTLYAGVSSLLHGLEAKKINERKHKNFEARKIKKQEKRQPKTFISSTGTSRASRVVTMLNGFALQKGARGLR